MSAIFNMSRREFLKTSTVMGSGLVLGFHLPLQGYSALAEACSKALFAPNAFIRIGTDNEVTIIVNKSEMGQGVYTSLPMMLAEELECNWSKVRVEAAPVDPAYNHTQWGTMQGTGGSSSVRSEWDRFRKAGATARVMLVAAAAAVWKVDPAECRTENGIVFSPDGKTLTYGQVAERAAEMPVPENVPLKSPAQFKMIGKPVHRLDTPEKTTGKAIFGIDEHVPNMVTALIARPPVFGGKIASLNADKARAVPGVLDVLQVPSGVAVIATGFWPAKRGRDLLEIQWDDGEGARLTTAGLREQFRSLAGTQGTIARKEGDPSKALRNASQRIQAEYEGPFLAHAMMETLNCLVDWRGDRCDIWTGTQFQTADRNAAAAVLGLKPGQVKIHTTFLGGGFGRRANPHSDYVVEAAHVAKAVKKPVKVIWTREDDIRGGYYRPMWYSRLAAGLDAGGNPVSWQHTIVGQSILAGTPFDSMVKQGIDATSVEGAQDVPYEIPNIQVDLHSPKLVVPVQWWRSVGHSHTAFVVESFIDELAHAAEKDPLQFRRKLLAKHSRHSGVLDLAAEKAGWGTALPPGRGRGIAMAPSYGSYVAQVAEVSVDDGGKIRVHRVVCAIDCGRVVNPDTIAAQMEGGIVFGVTAALYGAITLKDGRVEQSNFGDYPMLRINEMPAIEVYIVNSEEAPGGVGEPGVPPIAPAVANAFFAATGKRIRTLPIRQEELKQTALKGKAAG
ncbi:MAG TPA: xanthine dehydrogenase family protein molybdopterin-binding subunit [Syntrophales bacterium]|nr:xanthine dehydrogenase family protein molybdopterin-binding subunit [Syntrophales bacterium]